MGATVVNDGAGEVHVDPRQAGQLPCSARVQIKLCHGSARVMLSHISNTASCLGVATAAYWWSPLNIKRGSR